MRNQEEENEVEEMLLSEAEEKRMDEEYFAELAAKGLTECECGNTMDAEQLWAYGVCSECC